MPKPLSPDFAANCVINGLTLQSREMKRLKRKTDSLLFYPLKSADDPLLGVAYDILANKYTAAGMPLEALIYHLEGLKLSEMVLAPTDPDLGSAYYNTAITYSYLADLENCYEFMQKAVTIWERTLPSNNQDLVRSKEYIFKLKTTLNKL